MKLLYVTTDPVTATMPGPAIRAWNLAAILAGAGHEVVLASTVAADRHHGLFKLEEAVNPTQRRKLLTDAEVVVIPSGAFHDWPELALSDKPIVVDLYDPYHLENLERGAETPPVHAARVEAMTKAITAHMQRGDFFLSASGRQTDFWTGSLATAGRINPANYTGDPLLERLIAEVPFGMSSERPVQARHGLRGRVPGIGVDDKVILWGGGVYNWLDPTCVVEAMSSVNDAVPNARLVFLGIGHPNPAIPNMRVVAEARQAADRLGLTGSHVFFLEGWVPFDERADFLLDADVAVSAHRDHIETRYSFRTRVLDYIWAGLPMVLTEGDVLSDAIVQHGIGDAVPAGDCPALAEALVSALTKSRPLDSQFQPLRDELDWSKVARPLVEFCAEPRRAPDANGGGAVDLTPADEPYTPAMPSARSVVRSARNRVVSPVAIETAERMVQPVLQETANIRRILGEQGDAADVVAETLGRVLTQLSAEVEHLAEVVAELQRRLDSAGPPAR